MPYIITTATPLAGEPVGEPLDRVTRTAVATLDEVRDYVTGLFPFPQFGFKIGEQVGSDLSAMRESGGTIGPLPDGTVIEVRPVDWHDLIAANGGLCGHPITATDDAALAEVLEVYNAR